MIHPSIDRHELKICMVFTQLYLPSCSIQGLSYTRVVLSPYLYFLSFSFSWCIFFCHYQVHYQSIPSIYICPVFTSIAVHSLPLSPLPSVYSKYLYFFGKITFIVSFKQISFCNFSRVFVCICMCACVYVYVKRYVCVYVCLER